MGLQFRYFAPSMMHRRFVAFLLLCATANSYAQTTSFQRKTVDVGNIGFTVSNFGTIGNPVVISNPSNAPSMEYPLNSGVEHLFEGGLWIGAIMNGQIAVSTSAIDASSGFTTGGEGFEFTAPVGSNIQQRSTLTSSDFFSVNAISHEDLVTDFSDVNTIVPGTSTPIAQHLVPLGASVHLETYAWNYSFADYFVILNYTITNTSANNWDSVWLGQWTDLVVRNVNVATDNGAAMFSKGGGGFIDSLQALYAFDVNGDPGYTNSYGSTKFLGIEWRNNFIHPSNANALVAQGLPAPVVNANFWNFKQFTGLQFGSPANDVERYDKMKTGLDFSDPSLKATVQAPSNRVQLLSIGPLVQIEPGETITFAIAMVCAKQLETGGTTGPDKDTPYAQTELVDHLRWAQRTFNGEDQNGNGLLDANEDLDNDNILDRFILPEPPATPQAHAKVESNRVEIYWDNKAEASIDPISQTLDFEGYRIYRSMLGQDLTDLDAAGSADLLAQWDKAGNAIGYNNGFELIKLPTPVQFQNDTTHYTYKFVNEGLLNGWQYIYSLTAFDQGNDELKIKSLESSTRLNTFRVFPGTVATEDVKSVGVYPNPYRINAAWDGPKATDKKIYFNNLPERCRITIYTSGGDIVAELDHQGVFTGAETGWYTTFGGEEAQRVAAGGEHAWDLLSESNQTITQGIYMYSVQNLDTKEITQGTFAVIK